MNQPNPATESAEQPQAPQRHESTKGLRQTDVKFPPIHYIRRIATLEAQLSAALEREKEYKEKGEALCSTLGNLSIHIHELGLRPVPGEPMGAWRFTNTRAEQAEAELTRVRANVGKHRWVK